MRLALPDQVGADPVHPVLDGDVVDLDFVHQRARTDGKHLPEGLEQIEEADGSGFQAVVVLGGTVGLEVAHAAGVGSPLLRLHGPQVLGGLLESAVLQELADELLSVESVELLRFELPLLLAREEFPGLEGKELRGHDQELAGDAQLGFVGILEEGEVLVGDLRHGDRARVQLVVVDQVEEEVQRAREDVEGHGGSEVGHGGKVTPGLVALDPSPGEAGRVASLRQ